MTDRNDLDIAPFGAPDADGANLDPRAFIEFSGRRFRAGLGMDFSDSGIRVITGGKGAGKTHYLRRFQSTHVKNRSIYVDAWRNQHPTSDRVLTVWAFSTSKDDCRARWTLIWRRAIVRSTVSHIVRADRLRSLLTPGVRDRLIRDFPELLGHFESPSSIVSQVQEIIDLCGTRTEMDEFLHHPRWEALEVAVAAAIDDVIPIYFVVDGLDEEFEFAPSQWMDCQVGLLRQIIALRSDANLGRRLHLIAGIRDVVHSDWQRSEHALRHYARPEIRHLPWDADAIAYFLHRKIEQLPDSWLMKPTSNDPVLRWLGLETVQNVKRDVREPIEEYLLRHTRLIPRDVIQLGNALCHCISRAVDMGDKCLSDEAVRQTVAKIARRIGLEQLRVVANHITADVMPREAVEYFFVESYVARAEVANLQLDDVGRGYEDVAFRRLRAGLAGLRQDRLTAARLQAFAKKFQDAIGDVDVLSMLWQHRLLGYVAGNQRLAGEAAFFTPGHDDNLSLPLDYRYYALAPVLIDATEGLAGVGAVVRL